jgi:hypothetical protein
VVRVVHAVRVDHVVRVGRMIHVGRFSETIVSQRLMIP